MVDVVSRKQFANILKLQFDIYLQSIVNYYTYGNRSKTLGETVQLQFRHFFIDCKSIYTCNQVLLVI